MAHDTHLHRARRYAALIRAAAVLMAMPVALSIAAVLWLDLSGATI